MNKIFLNCYYLSSVGVGLSFCWTLYQPATIAQIIPDTTLGNIPSSINPNGTINGQPAVIINGGIRRTNNLFHSFREFSLNNNQRVYFSNPTGVQTILARVTGINPSNILGTLGVNGNANLFLINPNGITFGRNARLDLQGSFVGSSASRINFSDGSEFSTIDPQTPSLLAINVPIGLQFGSNPGRILVQGDGRGSRRSEDPIITPNQAALRIPNNQTLALIGGEMLIAGGTLKTAGGRIELGSVATPGIVRISSIADGFGFNYADIANFGDIRLTGATSIDASGANAGNIQIQGKQIILQDGTQIETTTIATGAGGSLRVIGTDRVELMGSTADNPGDNRRFPTSISSDNREGSLIPNELIIETKQLILRNGARISASNSQSGVGGNITVKASELVELSGTGTSQGGLRSSAITVQTRGSGSAGKLTIDTRRLRLQAGAEASASTFGAGDGGQLIINATEQVELRGTSANGQLRSSLVAGVGNATDVLRAGAPLPPETAIGKGGNLSITTPQLLISDRATIAVSSRNANVNAKGAGELTINAQIVQLKDQGLIAAESFSGQGGNIVLKSQNSSSSSSLLLLRNGSRISATAGNAQNPGNGGNIEITTPLIVAIPRENSDITSNAFSGDGGRITINAESLIGIQFRTKPTILSDITASSERGNQGTVTLNTPDADPSRGLTVLPTVPIDVSQKIDRTCKPNAAIQTSTFITRGAGGLPVQPTTKIVPQVLVRLAQTAGPISDRSVSHPASIPVEAQTSIRLANGQIRFQSGTETLLAPTPQLHCDS